MKTFEQFYKESFTSKLTGLATAALLGSQLHSTSQSLGIRNNNPGNIRIGQHWEGLSGTNNGFATFKSPEYGVRAIVKTLKTYNTKYNLDTVDSIIKRWAPNSENPTSKYINFVSKKMNVKPNDKLDLTNTNQMFNLVKFIITFENGTNTYNDETILKGIQLAH